MTLIVYLEEFKLGWLLDIRSKAFILPYEKVT